MKTYRLIYVTVAVKVEPNADVHEVTSDMDYNFDHQISAKSWRLLKRAILKRLQRPKTIHGIR
jgi:hypothetical protein